MKQLTLYYYFFFLFIFSFSGSPKCQWRHIIVNTFFHSWCCCWNSFALNVPLLPLFFTIFWASQFPNFFLALQLQTRKWNYEAKNVWFLFFINSAIFQEMSQVFLSLFTIKHKHTQMGFISENIMSVCLQLKHISENIYTRLLDPQIMTAIELMVHCC